MLRLPEATPAKFALNEHLKKAKEKSRKTETNLDKTNKQRSEANR